MDEINLEEYQKTVEMYAKNGTNFLFHNQGNEHALIVFKSIFRNATSKIQIAAKALDNAEVANSQEYIDAMKAFLDQEKSELYLLLSDPVKEPMNLPLFKMIKEHKAYQLGRVHVKDGKGKNFRMNGQLFHFCVADDRMYRLESDIEKRAAECNFGDEVKSGFLAGLYQQAFDSVTDVYSL